MSTFAFIIHPIDPKADVARKYPLLARVLPERAIHFLSYYWPPVYLSRVRGIVSESTGEELTGHLIACPLTAQQLRRLPLEKAYAKIIQTGRLAERLGVDILGLGAFTSAIGDGGRTVAKALRIPVTTGDSYTVATAVALVEDVARYYQTPLEALTAAVVGATGGIGRTVALLLARRVGRLLVFSRRRAALERLLEDLRGYAPSSRVEGITTLDALRQAHIVVSVTGAAHPVLRPQHLAPGTVVVDMAIPRDATAALASRRDLLVLDGGLVRVPGPVRFGFNFGLPRHLAYACMAETMILALEKRFECYTLGKRIHPERVLQMQTWARKHGFRLAEWFGFNRPIREETKEAFREIWNQRLRKSSATVFTS